MPIIKDELGRTITVDKHEDRGVLLPSLEPLSVADHADTIKRMQGDVTDAETATEIIQETDKGGAKTEERTTKARREASRKEGQAKRRADDAKSASKADKESPQNIDLTAGVRDVDQDDALRGGLDTMKSPSERREGGSGDKATFAGRDISKDEARERAEKMK